MMFMRVMNKMTGKNLTMGNGGSRVSPYYEKGRIHSVFREWRNIARGNYNPVRPPQRLGSNSVLALSSVLIDIQQRDR